MGGLGGKERRLVIKGLLGKEPVCEALGPELGQVLGEHAVRGARRADRQIELEHCGQVGRLEPRDGEGERLARHAVHPLREQPRDVDRAAEHAQVAVAAQKQSMSPAEAEAEAKAAAAAAPKADRSKCHCGNGCEGMTLEEVADLAGVRVRANPNPNPNPKP